MIYRNFWKKTENACPQTHKQGKTPKLNETCSTTCFLCIIEFLVELKNNERKRSKLVTKYSERWVWCKKGAQHELPRKKQTNPKLHIF